MTDVENSVEDKVAKIKLAAGVNVSSHDEYCATETDKSHCSRAKYSISMVPRSRADMPETNAQEALAYVLSSRNLDASIKATVNTRNSEPAACMTWRRSTRRRQMYNVANRTTEGDNRVAASMVWTASVTAVVQGRLEREDRVDFIGLGGRSCAMGSSGEECQMENAKAEVMTAK
jgi:hypothetical protein